MSGKSYYMIRHYDKEEHNKKKDCYISNKSDFMDIVIELREYNGLIEDLVKTEIYGIRKSSKNIRSKVVTLLRQLNFPEKYILDKIESDRLRSEEILYNHRCSKVLVRCNNLTNKLKKNTDIDAHTDPTKLKSDIESIQSQCISFIVKNKLMPKDLIDKYDILSKFFRMLKMEMPKFILFRIFQF
jgi:hypothetical protein